MYKLPATFVGEYAEADADLTYKLYEKLSWEIVKDNLETVYYVECKLIHVIFQMTRNGVRFDQDRCLILNDKFRNKEKKLMNVLKILLILILKYGPRLLFLKLLMLLIYHMSVHLKQMHLRLLKCF